MEILIIVLFSLINGLFSMSELAVVSARKARLQHLAEQGNHQALATLALMDSPNRFFSTVQIAITLIGTAAGVFGGTTIAIQLEKQLDVIPLLEPYSEALSVLIVVALTTYLSLVLGELVPKRLAMRYPEAIALAITRPMNWLSWLAAPLVWLLSFSTDAILWLLRIGDVQEDSVTEAEIMSMIQQGARDGVFGISEPEMVEGVFRLDEIRIDSVMTSRPALTWLNVDAPESEIREILIENIYSAYPVYQHSVDNPLGVVWAKDLLHQALSKQVLDIRAVLQKVSFIPDTALAVQALEMFKSSGVHVALVVDEYGGITGLLTLNDLLEEIIGDLDQDEPDVVLREDGSWLVDGVLSIHRLEETLPKLELPEDEAGSYATLSGFIMMRLGRVPSASDHFEWQGYRFEVIDMDGNRIDKVLIQKLKEAGEKPESTSPSEQKGE